MKCVSNIVLATSAILTIGASTQVSAANRSAGSCGAVGRHHLRSDPTAPLIEVVRSGGLLPLSGVTIYGDGHVAAVGTGHLQDVNLRLSTATRVGLLRLAEGERFFHMPANIVCHTQAVDLRSITIAIHTTAGVHTVRLLTACRSSAYMQLYSVLTAITRISLGPGGLEVP